jgi:hypothetical protein
MIKSAEGRRGAQALQVRILEPPPPTVAAAQAEGVISLPDRRINLWTTPSKMSKPELTVKTTRNCPV